MFIYKETNKFYAIENFCEKNTKEIINDPIVLMFTTNKLNEQKIKALKEQIKYTEDL